MHLQQTAREQYVCFLKNPALLLEKLNLMNACHHSNIRKVAEFFLPSGIFRRHFDCNLVGYTGRWGISWCLAIWHWWPSLFPLKGLLVTQALVLAGDNHWSSRSSSIWQRAVTWTGVSSIHLRDVTSNQFWWENLVLHHGMWNFIMSSIAEEMNKLDRCLERRFTQCFGCDNSSSILWFLTVAVDCLASAWNRKISIKLMFWRVGFVFGSSMWRYMWLPTKHWEHNLLKWGVPALSGMKTWCLLFQSLSMICCTFLLKTEMVAK